MEMADHRFDAVDKTTYRDGMSRLGTSVSVVTTRWGGRRYGFTASAVCSVSDSPPTLLVCINRASSSYPAFEGSRLFCVNTLRPGQEAISEVFGGRAPSADKFDHGEWHDGLTGMPVLAKASVSFECEVADVIDHATHRVIFGRVVAISENRDEGTLMHCMRRYFDSQAAMGAVPG